MPHIVFWNLRANTNGYANKTNQRVQQCYPDLEHHLLKQY